MYEHQGLQDILFIMLYGGATLLAFVACCYLLLTHGNAFSAAIYLSKTLRRWAAGFMASVTASHIWWVMLGIYWLEDDRLLRNIVAITLDRLTFVPLMMCVLLRMLQDRKRPLWPVFVAMIPIAVIAVMSIINHNDTFEWYIEIYSAVLGVTFTIYYIYAVRQYGKWLHENFADLEHKEVWQSLILLACILFAYIAYTSNEGDLVTEYLAQVNTLIIITFILWRVETLQQLDIIPEEPKEVPVPDNISIRLEKFCEASRLYLQHDLTLQQLATAIGTNRTYLSSYFSQQGITYNTYINQLRIEHFIRLYRETASSSQPTTAKALAERSGFSSYITFSAAFKRFKGCTVTKWINSEELVRWHLADFELSRQSASVEGALFHFICCWLQMSENRGVLVIRCQSADCLFKGRNNLRKRGQKRLKSTVFAPIFRLERYRLSDGLAAPNGWKGAFKRPVRCHLTHFLLKTSVLKSPDFLEDPKIRT